MGETWGLVAGCRALLTVASSSGAQMEVDYTEKLNFSDDEENQTGKDKADSW